MLHNTDENLPSSIYFLVRLIIPLPDKISSGQPRSRTAAFVTVRVKDIVTDGTRETGHASQHLAINNNAATNTGADSDINIIVTFLSCTEIILAQRTCQGIPQQFYGDICCQSFFLIHRRTLHLSQFRFTEFITRPFS